MIKTYKFFDFEFEFEIHNEDELTSNIIRKYGCNIDMECVFAYTQILNYEDYFLDIGANIGWQTIFASKIVGENGKVFSFEPEIKNFNLLEKNVQRNNLSNVVLIQQALGEVDHIGELYKSEINFGNHVLAPIFLDSKIHKFKTEVIVVTLDKFLEVYKINCSKIKLIKLDVEGSESKVLQGGKNFFMNFRPKIILEYCPLQLRQCGFSVFDIFSFIDKHDYIPFFINSINFNNPVFKVTQLSFKDLLEFTQKIMNTTEYKDILLVHKDEL